MGVLGQMIVKTLPLVPKPIVARLSRPYIAGANLEDAVACTKELNAKGFRVTIDLLGEFVSDLKQVEPYAKGYVEILEAIQKHQLNANISVKPTCFGLLLDSEHCYKILEDMTKRASAIDNFMRIDMEDSPCTSITIDCYNRLRAQYGQKVGVVLQAYLRRTLNDIKAITQTGPSHFRLCKGIYVEPESIAFKGYQEVRDNFVAALEAMFDGGAFVGIATHDDYLVDAAKRIIQERGLGPDRYEFQMLLGVREPLRDQLLSENHNVRIYVPFGRDWYGYSIRRLKENPALASTMFKAILFDRSSGR